MNHFTRVLVRFFVGIAISCALFAGNFLPLHADEKSENTVPVADAPPKPVAPLPFVEGSWTLVLLPDTQHYSARLPGLFDMQTNWIARNKDKYNIKYVLHMGDITNNGTRQQWERARESMRLLDGQVPYVLNLGNHDLLSQWTGAASTRNSYLNDYFSAADFAKWPTYGGVMQEGRMDNSYHLFSAGGRDWIVISLAWAPEDDTVAWADGIMKKYPDRKGILVTHSYLDVLGFRTNRKSKYDLSAFNPHSFATPGTINDGEELWRKLVSKHDFAFVFCGHVGTNALHRLTSRNEKGAIVHQIMADFQDRELGGEAYMAILEFLPDGKKVQCKTYSPLYDNYLTHPMQQYTLKIE
jgi:hypothetical protein